MQSKSLAVLESHFPKKEKKREKKKNRMQQKRLPKNYETLSDTPKKRQKCQFEVPLHSHLGHLSCRFSTRHLDICAPPAGRPIPARPVFTLLLDDIHS
jgi:hypothetical protein